MFKVHSETRKYVYCHCPDHRDSTPSLCVTKLGAYAGYYFCFSCGKSGELKNKSWLQARGQQEPERDVDWERLQIRCRQNLRGTSFSTESLQYGIGRICNFVTFPVYNQYERVTGIQKIDYKSKRFWTGSQVGLFIPKLSWRKCHKLFITEGVKDGIAVLKLGLFSLARVSNAAQSELVNAWIRYRDLEDIPKVIIPDRDEPGIKGAKELWYNLDNASIKIPSKKDVRELIRCNSMRRVRKWLAE